MLALKPLTVTLCPTKNNHLNKSQVYPAADTSSASTDALSCHAITQPLLCLDSLPSGKIMGGGSRCCFLNTQS